MLLPPSDRSIFEQDSFEVAVVSTTEHLDPGVLGKVKQKYVKGKGLLTKASDIDVPSNFYSMMQPAMA